MTRPARKDLLWMAAGAAILLALMLTVLHFHKEQNPTEQLAFQARRVGLVSRMRLDLASASEAEKSAVMAITDEDSQTFADQSRAASAAVEQGRKELGELLQTGGTQGEKDILGQFSQGFAEFERIDNDLLSLAVKNTNLKASSLAFGPAAEALKEMDGALSRLVAESATLPESSKVTGLAFDARIAALRLQTMLPPHIAEERDEKMDEMEALMGKEEQEVRTDLEGLSALQKVSASPDFETAASRWARFLEIKAQILALSRENTNVRSLTISLDRKRKVMLMCQDALAALQQAIQGEPIAGVTYGRPVKPR